MKNHWIDEIRIDYLKQLLHESHIAIWRLKCREEDAISSNNWGAANVAAMNLDAEKTLYATIKQRLVSAQVCQSAS